MNFNLIKKGFSFAFQLTAKNNAISISPYRHLIG
jgi:hypothetical protein